MCFAPTILQADPFLAVMLEAGAELGSRDGAHGVAACGRGQRFSEFNVFWQPAQPNHGGQQTANHRAVTGPCWRLFRRGIGCFPLQLSFYCCKQKRNKNPLMIRFFQVHGFKINQQAWEKYVHKDKVKNYDCSKHHIPFPTAFSPFPKLLKEDRLTDMRLNNPLYMAYLEIEITFQCTMSYIDCLISKLIATRWNGEDVTHAHTHTSWGGYKGNLKVMDEKIRFLSTLV